MANSSQSVKAANARRSVTENLAVQNCFITQDAVWSAIRALKGQWFTLATLCAQMVKSHVSGVRDTTVYGYLQRLTRGEYLQARIVADCRQGNVNAKLEYLLVRDTGNEAPRLSQNGQPITQGSGNERMWRSMRILKEFSYIELRQSANVGGKEISDAAAKDYIHNLYKAGYLALTKPSKPGTPARYRFIPSKNTGPRAPMVQRTQHVFDPNLKKIVWSKGA